MAPGARRKFNVLIFKLKVFREKMHCIEESTCDIPGTFEVFVNELFVWT